MNGDGHQQDDGRDDTPRAVAGAGTDHAAFPVGVLAGAAIGGVGGALVGEETEGRTHDRAAGTPPVKDGAAD